MIRWALLFLGVMSLPDAAAAQVVDRRAAARDVAVELQRDTARLDQRLTEVRRCVAVIVGSAALAARVLSPASMVDTYLTGHR